jgi:hypothetical protein
VTRVADGSIRTKVPRYPPDTRSSFRSPPWLLPRRMTILQDSVWIGNKRGLRSRPSVVCVYRRPREARSQISPPIDSRAVRFGALSNEPVTGRCLFGSRFVRAPLGFRRQGSKVSGDRRDRYCDLGKVFRPRSAHIMAAVCGLVKNKNRGITEIPKKARGETQWAVSEFAEPQNALSGGLAPSLRQTVESQNSLVFLRVPRRQARKSLTRVFGLVDS